MKFEKKHGIFLGIFLSVTTFLIIVSILWRKGIIGSNIGSQGNKGNVDTDGKKDNSLNVKTNENKSPKPETKNETQNSSGSKANEEIDIFIYKDIFNDGDPSTWSTRLQRYNEMYTALLANNQDLINGFHVRLKEAFENRSVLDVETFVDKASEILVADYQVIIDLAKLLANINYFSDLIDYKKFRDENPSATIAEKKALIFKTKNFSFLNHVCRSRISKLCPFFMNITNNNTDKDPNGFVLETEDKLNKDAVADNSCRPLLMLSLYHHYFYVHLQTNPNFPSFSVDHAKVNTSKKNIEALEKVLGKVCTQI
jgi:hypothetical protein